VDAARQRRGAALEVGELELGDRRTAAPRGSCCGRSPAAGSGGPFMDAEQANIAIETLDR
jgi:hypothetical protein